LAVGTAILLALDLLDDQPGRYDGRHLPRASYHTEVIAHLNCSWWVRRRAGVLLGSDRRMGVNQDYGQFASGLRNSA
jgi:hypothetical protein